MFKCLECGRKFSEPRHIAEGHGFTYGPFEDWYVCPYCKDNNYTPLLRNETILSECVDKLTSILLMLNEFDRTISDALNSTALEGSKFDYARSELCDYIVELCCSEKLDLPSDIADKLFTMQTEKEASEILFALLENVEED